jgi:hypothetical protein
MQGVLVFASAAARDAAITSPQEGQCCYLKDTDAVLTYSGAAWVGFDDSNAIQNSIVDAKGDLVAASGADTPARLAVGADGSSIVADSVATTGLRYSATPSASNPIINSAFQIWQRGTSIAGSDSVSNYTADRWLGYTAVTSTFSRQATGDTTNLPNIQYAMRVQRTAGGTGTGHFYLVYSQESVNSIPYAGKSVTISFYARKGANFNEGTTGLSLVVGTGTGTDQNFLSGYTGSVTALNQPLTLTTTWVRYSYNLNIGATATELGFYFNHRASATAAGAADYYEVTGVQIDVGSVALPFRTNGGTIQGELAACQRYAFALTRTTGYNDYAQGGTYDSTTEARVAIPFTSQMRTSPTMTTTGTAADYGVLVASGNYALTGVPTLQSAHPQGATINLPRSGIYSTGQSVSFRDQNTAGTATYVLLFTAEL